MSISYFHTYFSNLTLCIGDAIADTIPNKVDIDPTLIENIRYAKEAEDFKMGNCSEQSSVALQYLKSQKKLSNLSSQSLIYADHAFLIIGKESDHFLEKSEDWKKSAVVCDPWARVVYPFSEYDYHIKKVCERNNLPLPSNNDFTSVEHYFYQSKELQEPIKPTLKPESDQLLQTQLKNYQSYKNRMLTHAYLEKKSQDASITLAAIGTFTSLGSITRKIKGRIGFFIEGSSFIASAGCFFAREFFPEHAKMYEEKIHAVWH